MALGADQNRVGVLEDIVPGTSRGTSIGTVTIVNHFEKVPERLHYGKCYYITAVLLLPLIQWSGLVWSRTKQQYYIVSNKVLRFEK